MLAWSRYFQNPAFLEYTRKFLIPPEMVPLVLTYCCITEGMRVLDVGCGTGFLGRLIASSGMAGVSVTGVDTEPAFIDEARRIACEGQIDNITFAVADACRLPFDDCHFDAVVSHTFFTCVPDPVRAINEMKRVCKPLGPISSITPMVIGDAVYSPGRYPPSCTWLARLNELEAKKWAMYEAVAPVSGYMNRMNPADIPRFFSGARLSDVSIYPVGRAFSLSNHAIAPADKEAYIKLMYDSEMAKLQNIMALGENDLFTTDDFNEYETLFKQKTWFLLENIQENYIWEWRGSCSLLVTGRTPLRLDFLSAEVRMDD